LVVPEEIQESKQVDRSRPPPWIDDDFGNVLDEKERKNGQNWGNGSAVDMAHGVQ